MGPIPTSLHPPIFIVLVIIGTIFVQRKFGWKGLIGFWLASTTLATGFYTIWSYLMTPLSGWEALGNVWPIAWRLFVLFLILSGMVVWMVAIFVLPPAEPVYFPPMAPVGGLEDAHELPGIPLRYQELLAAYVETRKKAVIPPSLRMHFPSYMRQRFFFTRQLWRVPHVIMRGFVAAEPVLAELEKTTTTQLSALEAYHRINLKYVKRHLIPLRVIVLSLSTAVLATSKALSSLIPVMEKRGMIPNFQWEATWASALAFAAQPPNWGIMSLIIGVPLGLLVGIIAAWSQQRLLVGFSDILIVALAHRRREITTNPSLE